MLCVNVCTILLLCLKTIEYIFVGLDDDITKSIKELIQTIKKQAILTKYIIT